MMVKKTFCDICSSEIEDKPEKLALAEDLHEFHIKDAKEICSECAECLKAAYKNPDEDTSGLLNRLKKK